MNALSTIGLFVWVMAVLFPCFILGYVLGYRKALNWVGYKLEEIARSELDGNA
jgi:hypothetical protein